jgi:hypothetical protein
MNLFEIFKQNAKFETNARLIIPVYKILRPKPTRKKRRIQKKFAKRFGTGRKLLHIERMPIDHFSDVPKKYRKEDIELSFRAQTQNIKQSVSPPVNFHDINALSPTAVVSYKIRTIEFPRIGYDFRIKFYDFVEYIQRGNVRNDLQRKFMLEAERFVNIHTKVSEV